MPRCLALHYRLTWGAAVAADCPAGCVTAGSAAAGITCFFVITPSNYKGVPWWTEETVASVRTIMRYWYGSSSGISLKPKSVSGLKLQFRMLLNTILIPNTLRCTQFGSAVHYVCFRNCETPEHQWGFLHVGYWQERKQFRSISRWLIRITVRQYLFIKMTWLQIWLPSLHRRQE